MSPKLPGTELLLRSLHRISTHFDHQLQPKDPGASLTLDHPSFGPLFAELSSMSQSREGRFHSKKAGIRAAVILIGLLHKSRKAKEKEREKEKEESEGWVKFVQLSCLRQRRMYGCSAALGCDCEENFIGSQRLCYLVAQGTLCSSWFSEPAGFIESIFIGVLVRTLMSCFTHLSVKMTERGGSEWKVSGIVGEQRCAECFWESRGEKRWRTQARKSEKCGEWRGRGQRPSTHLFVSFLHEVSEQLEWTLVDVANVDEAANTLLALCHMWTRICRW